MPRRPTVPLFWLLRIVASPAAADAAVGDMLEELAARNAGGGMM